MDYDKVDAESFGASLRGIGLNLLVRDVLEQTAFLETVFEMNAFQATKDFAIMKYGDQVFQIHSDGTYHSHPLLSLVPEQPPRGGGIEIRLYESDPDACVARAEALGDTVRVSPGGEAVEGVFETLAEDGGLVLRLPNGARETIRAGDVELVKQVGR